MAVPLLAALGLPLLGLAGGGMSMFGGAMSLGGGLLHAGSTAVGLGAKGIGAIGKAAGGLIPGGEDGGQMQPAQQGLPDINGKYFNDNTQRWHDRNNNNRFTTAPAQFGAQGMQGMAGGSGLAGGAGGGGQQMEMDFGGTGGMNEPEEVGPFGMLVGLLAGMANDISAIKGLTSGILSTMVANEAEDDQQDAQMSLFNEEQLAQGEEAQRKAQDLIDKGEREGSLTDTGGTNEKGQGLLGKAFGPIKSGWNKILNQPNWLKALGLGGLLWWLSNNKEGFVKGLTVVLEWVQDLTQKFKNADFEDFTIKGFAANLAEGIGGLFTKIKESETFKNLISTAWPALRDMIQDFTNGMFATIWDITKEMIFGARDSAAIREQGGEALKHRKQIVQVEAAIGKGPLTEKIVKDAPKAQKNQIKQFTDELWENMQEITEQSDWRVQWTGIPWNTTDSDIMTEIFNAFGATKPPIDVLMKALPIVDGEISTWAKLKSINLRAGISEDATDSQRATIETNLGFMSQVLSTITTLEAEKAQLGPEPSAEKKKALRGTAMVHSPAYITYHKKLNEINAKIAAANKRYTGYKATVDELNVDLPELIESDVQDTATATDGTATVTSTEGTTSTDDFKGGGGFRYVNGELVSVNQVGDLSKILPTLTTPSSLSEGITRDWDVRNMNTMWGSQKLFTGSLTDWLRVRANTIRLGPWDNSEEGKAHWEHMIRTDNWKIIGLSGRDDAHRMANLADPVGYALADLNGSLDEFVHGNTIGGGAMPVPLVNDVGGNVRTLQGLTTNQLQFLRGDSGTAGGASVTVATGAKTNISNTNVNATNLAAKDSEWTQKILNSPRFSMYNFAN